MTEQETSLEAVANVLRASPEYIDLNQIIRASGVAESAAKACLRALATSGQIEHIAGAGRRPTRYGWLHTGTLTGNGTGEALPPAANVERSAPGTDSAVHERELTPEAQAEREQFFDAYGYDGNCSCHLSSPCGSCTHPGNPRNQEEDETAWLPVDHGSMHADAETTPPVDPNPVVDAEPPFDMNPPPPAGYLVRIPKRKPRIVRDPHRAVEVALAACRNGAGRAEVFELLPLGTARRGAEFDPA